MVVPPPAPLWLALLSTPSVYAELDRQRGGDEPDLPSVADGVLAALRAGDPVALGLALRNDLQGPALQLRPSLARVLDAGRELGAAGGIVSGSGPTVALLARTPGDAAFYPLTFPMIVGPGTITTLLVFHHEAGTGAARLAFWAVLAAMLALLGLALFFAGAIGAHLSAKLRVIMSRLMGMILLAIAVSMLVAGLKALLPGLA